MTLDNDPKFSSAVPVEDPSADSAASRQRRKKRKWDQPADSLVSAGLVVPAILPLPHMLPAIGIPHPGTLATLLKPSVPPSVAQIQKCTGAIVITSRGKYRPPNALPDGEKPLYLHISAGAHLKEMAEKIIAVDRAAALVEEMLKLSHILQAASTTHASENILKGCQALNTRVFLGFDADPSANIASRIRGPNALLSC